MVREKFRGFIISIFKKKVSKNKNRSGLYIVDAKICEDGEVSFITGGVYSRFSVQELLTSCQLC